MSAGWTITFDCVDPAVLAAFWCQALGYVEGAPPRLQLGRPDLVDRPRRRPDLDSKCQPPPHVVPATNKAGICARARPVCGIGTLSARRVAGSGGAAPSAVPVAVPRALG
jgi:hypothetical protein